MMEKFFSTLFVIIFSCAGYATYIHRDDVIDYVKYTIQDPAEYVLNANVPQSELIASFQNNNYGEVQLLAGSENGNDFGFRHILARHTPDYFINFNNKNKETLFDKGVSGKDLLLGLKDFYKHCVEVDAYNTQPQTAVVYVGSIEIDNKTIRCLLVVNKDKRTIITFYPLTEIKEDKVLLDYRGRFVRD